MTEYKILYSILYILYMYKETKKVTLTAKIDPTGHTYVVENAGLMQSQRKENII